MAWMWVGLAALVVDIALFAAIGWYFMRREETKLDDGNNPYTPRNQRKRWWR